MAIKVKDFLDKKFAENTKIIKVTFYELRIKENLSYNETKEFLDEIKEILEDEYNLYETGEEYYFDGIKKVETNELLVAIKRN